MAKKSVLREHSSKKRIGKTYAYVINTTGEAWKILRERAKDLRLTDKIVSRLIGISQTGVAHWNSGKREPSIAHIAKLCEELGCEMEISLKIKKPPEKIKRIRKIINTQWRHRQWRRKIESLLKSDPQNEINLLTAPRMLPDASSDNA